jgi:hypothetical protein
LTRHEKGAAGRSRHIQPEKDQQRKNIRKTHPIPSGFTKAVDLPAMIRQFDT